LQAALSEHREKANGIDQACVEDRPIGNTCSDTHQDGGADHAGEGAHHVYDTVCRELPASILHESSCGLQTLAPNFGGW
jgi:hypothetical protein